MNVRVHTGATDIIHTDFEQGTTCRVHLGTISISQTPLVTLTGTEECPWTYCVLKIKAKTVALVDLSRGSVWRRGGE